jgi:hypothetical protein
MRPSDPKKRTPPTPEEKAALIAMFEAYQELIKLGWRSAIYAPKDGTPLEIIELGSTGIHHGWHDGKFLFVDDGEIWPVSHGALLHSNEEWQCRLLRAKCGGEGAALAQAESEAEGDRQDYAVTSLLGSLRDVKEAV